MKKIDSWLSIQRYVAEAVSFSAIERPPDVEVVARIERVEHPRLLKISRIT